MSNILIGYGQEQHTTHVGVSKSIDNTKASSAYRTNYAIFVGNKRLNSVWRFLLLQASCSNHCLAALDLGAGVEQQIDWLGGEEQTDGSLHFNHAPLAWQKTYIMQYSAHTDQAFFSSNAPLKPGARF